MPSEAVDWAAAGTRALQQDTAEQVRGSLREALPVNPDKEAELRRYAGAAGVPLDTARAQPDDTRAQAQMSTVDADRLTRDFPHTARWIRVPDNAKLAHDVIPQTTEVEQAVRALAPRPAETPFTLAGAANYVFGNRPDNGLAGDLGRGFGQTMHAGAAAFNIVAGALPVFIDKMAGGGRTSNQDWWFRNMVDPQVAQAAADEVNPDAAFGRKAVHTAGATLGMLAQVALTGGGGAPAAAGEGVVAATKGVVEHGAKAMAFPALSDSINMGRKVFEGTGDPIAAFRAAAAQWLGTSAMGGTPLSVAGGMTKRLTTGALVGGASGEATRSGVNLALPDKMQSGFDWEQVFLSMLSGSMLAGVMGPREQAALTPYVTQAYRDAYAQAKAEGSNQQLMDLAKASTASKLRERDPAAFKDFVRSTAEGGDLPGVFIEAHALADVLKQSDVTPDELRQTMPEVALQLDAALGENAPKNGLVSIPIEDFATHIAGSELEKPLMQHLRVDPEGGTVAESEAFKQSEKADMTARADAISSARAGDEAYQASLAGVAADLQTRLEATGMRPEQAHANLAPLLAFHQVHADQMGILPHEFAERYPLRFAREALDGFEQRASDVGHKREEGGRYVGAPDWVGKSPQKLAVLRDKLRQLAREGERGRFWYENSSLAILKEAGGDRAEAEKIAGLIAIYSPSNTVPGNTSTAIKAHHQWKMGEPTRAGTGDNDAKAQQWMDSGKDWGGIKTNSFYQGLMTHIDPSKLDPTRSTMDMWLALSADYGSKVLDQGPKYLFMQRETARLAAELGWTPHQAQAAVWTAIKGRVEASEKPRQAYELKKGIAENATDPETGKTTYAIVKGREKDHFRAAHKFGMEHVLTHEDVTRAKYDFSDALAERTVQMSWEAKPGESTGVLPGIFGAPMEQQREYFDAVVRALQDEQGHDLIAQKLGISTGSSPGPAGWKGVVGVGAQDTLAVSVPGGVVAPASRRLISLWSNIRGLVLAQEGMAWHYPHYKGAKSEQNGVHIDLGRPLTLEEAGALYAALAKELGHDQAPPIHHPEGFRVLNFYDAKFALADNPSKTERTALLKDSAEANKAFHAAVQAAVESVPSVAADTKAYKRFQSEGDLYGNDWSKGDADYRARIEADASGLGEAGPDGGAGGSDLLKWVDDFLHPRVEAVNADFAARYGWDKPAQGALDGSATAAGSGEFRQSGNVRGGDGLLAEPVRSAEGDARRESDGSLRGLPRNIPGFTPSADPRAAAVARAYMEAVDLPYTPPDTFVKADPARGARIAAEFEAMRHDPQNPGVKAAYEAMIAETVAQYEAILKTGIKIEFIDFAKTGDPYAGNPRAMTDDVRNNNHMWVFSTREGFGTDATFDPKDNPLLAETGHQISGQTALANDIFRVVHDYFGHVKEGVGFRADGEENAWRAHMAMYSETARRAATTETRGQNSWLNFGPHGETNRSAKVEDTHFADQKIGLLPDWVVNEGRGDDLAQTSRGAFSPSTKTISLLKGADLSTFQHELGHYFLDTLSHLALQTDAPPAVVRDMQTLLKWFGVPDLDTWHGMSVDEQRQHHEAFATGWETYLMKGQAPTLEMRSLFQRFRSWMLSVYKALSAAPGEFTPEVRGVFDRMIASEEAIREAEQARKYMPLFDTPEKSGMSPEEWAAYQATGRDATELAIEQLIGKGLRDMAWMDRLRTASLKAVERDAAEKRKAILREVRPEVMAQPVYRAWAFLTGKDQTALPDQLNAEHAQAVRMWQEKRDEHETETRAAIRLKAWEESGVTPAPGQNPGLAKGQWLAKNRARLDLDAQRAMLDYDAANPKPQAPPKPAGSTDPTSGAGKLNLGALKALSPELAKQLQDRKMTAVKGIDPGVVADMFGFPDAEALATALARAEHPREVVNGMADQRMLERHGELIDADAVRRTADQLVQNEVRARFVATELRALRQATGKPKDITAAAKEAAANTIDSKRIRDINERQFSAAETRSATQAEKAMAAGDTEGAAVAKRDQLLNIELARAARDAKEYVVKSLAYLSKFDKASVREGIDLEYRDQIDQLLARADLRKSVTNQALGKREALATFVERMAAEGYQPNIPEHLLLELETWHYKDMPMVAFRGLVDSIKSIEHLGKMKSKLLDGKETRELNDLADEAAASAGKLPQRAPESNRGLNRMESKWLATKAFGRSIGAGLLKMEQMFDWLDARNAQGVFNRVVFRRIADAGVRKGDMMARVKGEIDKLIDSHLADVTKVRTVYTAPGLIDSKTGLPQKLTTKEMLMLAGNYGNESNLAKMAKGEGWDPAQVKAFLDANMTKAHWDFVAGMAKTIESLWPEKIAMDRRLGNTSPEKIQPRPFDTPHGSYDGWYWPMMYDPARSQDVAERGARAGEAMFENIFQRANTDTGRMNTRSEAYARPLLLDLDALPRMIQDEIHDLAYREAIIDADKFLSHPTVRHAIVDALSVQHYDQLRPWLQSIANDGKMSNAGLRGMEWLNKISAEARTRATMVGLGFRLTTAMVHGMSAGAESVSELGAKWMGAGLVDFKNPLQWAANKDFIFERSGEMRNRANEVDRDIREHLVKINQSLMDPATGAVARGAELMRAHAYSLIAGLDMASALPTWMGAYKKGLTPVKDGGLGLSEVDAVYFADKTVRNAHGGSGIKDMARVQRGNEFQKLFTMFYTFWNHNVNRIMDTAKLVTSPEHRAAMKEANHWSTTQLASTIIMRTLVYTLGVQVLHSLLHPPKEGEDELSWFKWAAKEFTAAAFAGIPIARDLSSHFIAGKPYSATPAASVVDAVGRTGADALNALQGREVSDKWLKHTITTAGYAANLPLGQPASTAQFLWDVGGGREHPESAKEWWNGVLHGTAKQH